MLYLFQPQLNGLVVLLSNFWGYIGLRLQFQLCYLQVQLQLHLHSLLVGLANSSCQLANIFFCGEFCWYDQLCNTTTGFLHCLFYSLVLGYQAIALQTELF